MHAAGLIARALLCSLIVCAGAPAQSNAIDNSAGQAPAPSTSRESAAQESTAQDSTAPESTARASAADSTSAATAEAATANPDASRSDANQDQQLYCPTPTQAAQLASDQECDALDDPSDKAQCQQDFLEQYSCRPKPDPAFILDGNEYYRWAIQADRYCGNTGDVLLITATADYYLDRDIYGATTDITGYVKATLAQGGEVARITSQGDKGIGIVFDATGFAKVRISTPQARTATSSELTGAIHLGAIASHIRPVTVRQIHAEGCSVALFQTDHCDVASTDKDTLASAKISFATPEISLPDDASHTVSINPDCSFGQVEITEGLIAPDFDAMPMIELR